MPEPTTPAPALPVWAHSLDIVGRLVERIGFAAIFAVWLTAAGVYVAPFLPRLTDAAELSARQAVENGKALEELRQDHVDIRTLAREAREAAQRAEMAARSR